MAIIVKQVGYTTVSGDPQNLVDGNPSTGWTPAAQAPSGGFDNGFIQFDFVTPTTLSSFSALFANPNSFGIGLWVCSDFDATVFPFNAIHDGDQVFAGISGSILGSGDTLPIVGQTKPRRFFRLLGGPDPTTGATDGTELFEFKFDLAQPAIKRDTTNGNRVFGTGGTVAYSTNNANEILLLLVNSIPSGGGSTPALVSSVTDTNHLTWAKRSATTGPLGWTPGGNTVDTVEVWWAAVPTASSGTVTVEWPSPGVQIASISTAAFTGVASLTSPWDENPSLPAVTSFSSLAPGTTSFPAATFNTSGPSFAVGVFGSAANGNNGTPNGWLDINANNGSAANFQCTNDSIGQGFSEPQTSTTVTMRDPASTWVMVVDALANVVSARAEGWNPLDKANAITLSNNNRTATSTNDHGGYIVRGTGHSTGKWYIEYQGLVVDAVQTQDYAGFAALPEPLETSSFSSSNQITYKSPGGTVSETNAAFTTNLPTYNSATLCAAIDIDNSLVWFRVNDGNWNSITVNQDPTLGVSFFDRTISDTEWYPMVSLRSIGDAATIAETSSEFLFAPPAGFSPWGGGGSTVIVAGAFSDGDDDALTATAIVAARLAATLLDGDSDALTATATIIDINDLHAAFTDGDSDALGIFVPRVAPIQISLMTTGR